MTLLGKADLMALLKSRELQFEPELDAFQLQPNGIDIRLGYDFRIPKMWKISEKGREALSLIDYLENSGEKFEEIALKEGQFIDILPQETVIASSLEKISINSNRIVGRMDPRSSLVRRGLSSDLSGIIDVGYKGKLIIPLRNNLHAQSIRLYPTERIAQLTFSYIETPSETYNGKYKESEKISPYKLDGKEETNLIKKGKIDEIKKNFALKL